MIVATVAISPSDTLSLNTECVTKLQGNSLYDYSREVLQTGSSDSLLERLLRELFRAMDVPTPSLDADVRPLLYIVFLIVLAAIVFLLFRYGKRWFGRPDVAPMDYTVTEDNIFGVDFDTRIAEARRDGRWREVVRLTYLKTLRQLDDNGCIDWQPHKTPRQYAGEFGNADFADMTRTFVRVRYGEYEVDEPDVDRFSQLHEVVSAAIAARRVGEEGGDES